MSKVFYCHFVGYCFPLKTNIVKMAVKNKANVLTKTRQGTDTKNILRRFDRDVFVRNKKKKKINLTLTQKKGKRRRNRPDRQLLKIKGK